jgi:hypothetical protein
MPVCLRIWLFAFTALLLAEDFQYLLKIENTIVVEQKSSEGCGDAGNCDDSGGKQENEEEQKEEKKEKDEDKNRDSSASVNNGTRLAKIKFSNTRHVFPGRVHELESPPPEV